MDFLPNRQAVANRRPRSARPAVDALETRDQPGSLLATAGVSASLAPPRVAPVAILFPVFRPIGHIDPEVRIVVYTNPEIRPILHTNPEF